MYFFIDFKEAANIIKTRQVEKRTQAEEFKHVPLGINSLC